MLALTNRESQVLDLLCEGLTNRQIWRRLYITQNTLNTHLQSIYIKLGVANRNQAAIWGRANGYGQKDETSNHPPSLLPFDELNPRQLEVVMLVARGKTNRQIGRELRLSPTTVRWHLVNAGKILGEGTRELIAKAYNEFQASKRPSP